LIILAQNHDNTKTTQNQYTFKCEITWSKCDFSTFAINC